MDTRPKPCPVPPSPLFHSSAALLDIGDVLVPGRVSGTSRGHFVWMNDRPSWWNMADRYVYEVMPLVAVEVARGYWRTTRARVVRIAAVRQPDRRRAT